MKEQSPSASGELWRNIRREQELRDTRYADLVTDAILDR